ncbi:hypothetical protein POM88_015322 [Heracleum sosnowskyi]|uniref:CG-1 domain-containing protein n=1 Tax=Heracleum sosnowskyi TaxID=360622 RepID=A0AAD8IJP8_9APIA|nr:hypothetical protein POM88_015322 [Heracleum sosnowskyi]
MIPSLRDSKKRRHRSNKGNSVGCATTELQTLCSYSGRYNGQVKGEIRRLSTGPLIFLPMGKEDIISFSSVCGSELESLSQTCRRYWKKQSTAGSLFLFDLKVLRYFRRDGHRWRKKKDRKTVREAHEKLKMFQWISNVPESASLCFDVLESGRN